ncbi:MAG: hypothetical protein GY841_20930, partial [FCB group bacterium]|nr:hypothetical protein [FCB group bacterium]
KLKAFDPDRMLDMMLRPLRPLFTPVGMSLMILFVFAGVYTYSANFEYFRFTPADLFNLESILIILLSIAVFILMHEFAHALTCKFFGGQVKEMGFLLLYFQICFYSNLSDSWMFKRKSSRLAVIWAGLFFQMVIFAAAVFGWRMTVIGTVINQFFWLTANVCLFTLLFNLNPLIKLDGYYLLSEIVNIPNLRKLSFDYLRLRIKNLIGIDTIPTESDRKRQRIFLTYTVLAAIYSIGLIGYMATLAYRFLVDNLGGTGFVLFLILLTVIFKTPLMRTIRFIFNREVLRAVISKPRNLIVGGIFAVLLILVLFVVSFPRQVGGSVLVRPSAEYTITLLSEQGRLELNHRIGGHSRKYVTEHIQLSTGDLSVLRLTPLVKEGDIIQRGDTLAAIISTQVSTGLSAARAELERLRGELALAKSPPKPEEIKSVEAAVNAAKASVSQLETDISLNQSLFQKKLISNRELEKSQSDLTIAQSLLEESEARLRLLTSPPKPEEVAIIESKITTQEANINYLTTQEAAQVITSPIDGELVALYRNNLLFKVADMSQIEVAIPITDNYLEYVKSGAEIGLRVRSFPNSLFIGEVTHIAGSANAGSYNDTRARFEVYALLDNNDNFLRDGMSGYAKVSCGEASLFTIITERIKAFIRVEFWSWW